MVLQVRLSLSRHINVRSNTHIIRKQCPLSKVMEDALLHPAQPRPSGWRFIISPAISNTTYTMLPLVGFYFFLMLLSIKTIKKKLNLLEISKALNGLCIFELSFKGLAWMTTINPSLDFLRRSSRSTAAEPRQCPAVDRGSSKTQLYQKYQFNCTHYI